MTRPIVELHYFQDYPKVWSPVLIRRDFQSSLYLPAFIQKWQSAVGGHHGGLATCPCFTQLLLFKLAL